VVSGGTITFLVAVAPAKSGFVYPTGTVNVTGILGEYSSGTFTPQFSIRNTTDVQ